MYAPLDGTRLFFDVDGPQWVPDGDQMRCRPVLFLLHGGPGGDHGSFKKTVGQLRDVAQLVYVDHRGSGRSDPVDIESCTLDTNIDDVERLREYLGLESISLLGSSYGGMVAQGYAIRYPDNLDRLVLSATAPSFRFLAEAQERVEREGSEEQKRVCQWLWEGTFQSLDQLKRYYRAMAPWYAVSFQKEKFEESWGRGIRNFQQTNLGFSSFLREFDFTPQLDQLRCPVLVLAGEKDWICAAGQSREIARRIPQAELHVFPDAAHSIAEDQPDEFLALVRQFLDVDDI
jgi:proline iminopeptidase